MNRKEGSRIGDFGTSSLYQRKMAELPHLDKSLVSLNHSTPREVEKITERRMAGLFRRNLFADAWDTAIKTLPILVGLFASDPTFAQSSIPSQTAEDLEHGRRLFERQCARCHGMDGAGGTGPTLISSVLRRVADDQDLFSIIREGVRGTEMPAAWQMIDQEIWQVAGYVRSLGHKTQVSWTRQQSGPRLDRRRRPPRCRSFA